MTIAYFFILSILRIKLSLLKNALECSRWEIISHFACHRYTTAYGRMFELPMATAQSQPTPNHLLEEVSKRHEL